MEPDLKRRLDDIYREVRATNGRVTELERAVWGDHRPGHQVVGLVEQAADYAAMLRQWSALTLWAKRATWAFATAALAGAANWFVTAL